MQTLRYNDVGEFLGYADTSDDTASCPNCNFRFGNDLVAMQLWSEHQDHLLANRFCEITLEMPSGVTLTRKVQAGGPR